MVGDRVKTKDGAVGTVVAKSFVTGLVKINFDIVNGVKVGSDGWYNMDVLSVIPN